MRTKIINSCTILLGLVFAGWICTKAFIPRTYPAPVEQAEELWPLPVAVDSKKATVPSVTLQVIETLPEPAVAPMFVTRERISQTDDKGVRSIAKGAQVEVIERRDGLVFISDGRLVLPARPDAITSDLTLAASLTAEKAEIDAQEERRQAVMESARASRPEAAPSPPASIVGVSSNPPSTAAQALEIVESKIDAVKAEIKRLEAADVQARATFKISGYGPVIARQRIILEQLQRVRATLRR